MNQSTVCVANPTCEYQPNALGIDADRPRFSWIMEADRPGAAQTAYVLALAFDLLEDDHRDLAAKRLARMVEVASGSYTFRWPFDQRDRGERT